MLKEKYLEVVSPFIEHRSISTDKEYKSEIDRTVDWLVELFKLNGSEVEIHEGYGNPIILASYHHDQNLKSALIYGHYDVQPAPTGEWLELPNAQKDGWNSPPFSLTQDKDRVFARGIADNKGQVGMHMAAIFRLIEMKELGYNVSFLFEGDEETGEGKIEQFIQDQEEKLKEFDFVVISDGLLENNIPTIERSFRGSMSCTMKFITSDNSLHSGLYGGIVPSASNELTRFLAKLEDENGKIIIPGWYNGINVPADIEILDEERLKRILEVTGVKRLVVSDDEVVQSVALLPSLTVTGLISGYNDEGYQNSIPGLAQAKLNFRLAPGQDPQKLIEHFQKFVSETVPDYVEIDVQFSGAMEGVYISADSSEFQRAQSALLFVYGKFPIHAFIGASMPISVQIEQRLGVPQLLLPLANDDSAIHGANENLTNTALENGLNFSYLFFSNSQL